MKPAYGDDPTLKVANCSGFYGDRLSAMREQLEGGDIDVVTGDYLAELTMLILARDTYRDPSLGYAKTFVTQVEDCLGLALEKGVKIVSNAGGLNPAGLADKLREVAAALGLDANVAHVEGDDLRGSPALEVPNALSVNAYLGGFGIARALTEGADIVVTGRVTDASVVVGPAAAYFGWTPEQYDELAGAVVAGHIIECGAQATGGNFSGFRALPAESRAKPLGFPIAEIARDGSCVITKHDGTGGAVTVDTVTAQLVYEIQSVRYLGPDVTTDLTSISLAQEGEDRVAITGVRGEAPPPQLKVCVNELGGHRNMVEFVLTGLDIEAKAEWVQAQFEAGLVEPPASLSWSRSDSAHPDAPTEEAASTLLRCIARDPKPEPVGKAFSSAAVELALASYPGFTMTAPPGRGTPYGVYRPAYVDRSAVTHTVVLADGSRITIDDPPVGEAPGERDQTGLRVSPYPAPQDAVTRRVPLGKFVQARSGDKGGDANLGLWVQHDGSPKYADRVTWLNKLITPKKIRELVPEAEDLEIEVYTLPNLGGVNVLIRGLLGEGVSSSTRFDPQAKGLGEWVRSRLVHIREELL
jgi:hypothetical protein